MPAAVAGSEDGEALVAVLEAVAVRTGVRTGSPHVGEAGDVGELVEHPRGEEQRARHFGAVRRSDPDAAVEELRAFDLEGNDLHAVARQLGAAAGAELRGSSPSWPSTPCISWVA